MKLDVSMQLLGKEPRTFGPDINLNECLDLVFGSCVQEARIGYDGPGAEALCGTPVVLPLDELVPERAGASLKGESDLRRREAVLKEKRPARGALPSGKPRTE